MAEDLFAYPIVSPPTNPRPKTSRTPRSTRRTTRQTRQNRNISHPGEESAKSDMCDEIESNNSNNYNNNKNISNNTNFNRSVNNINDPNGNLNEEENMIDSWTRYAINGGDLTKCDPSLLPAIISNLRLVRDSLLTDGYADDSCITEDALAHARKVHKDNLVLNATESYRNELNDRLNEADGNLQDIEETVQYQESRMEEIFVRENAVLEDRQTKEMDQFMSVWESPDKARSYNKISGELRLLRDQADRLLRSKRFEESRRVEKKANQLEKIESERNHQIMENEFALQLKVLQERHLREKQKQETAQQNRRKEYYAARDFDLNVARKRKEKIEKEKELAEDPDKLWARYHRHDFELPPPEQSNHVDVVDRGQASHVTLGKRAVAVQEFNTLRSLPPLKTGRSSKRIIRHSERNYKFNKNYVFM